MYRHHSLQRLRPTAREMLQWQSALARPVSLSRAEHTRRVADTRRRSTGHTDDPPLHTYRPDSSQQEHNEIRGASKKSRLTPVAHRLRHPHLAQRYDGDTHRSTIRRARVKPEHNMARALSSSPILVRNRACGSSPVLMWSGMRNPVPARYIVLGARKEWSARYAERTAYTASPRGVAPISRATHPPYIRLRD